MVKKKNQQVELPEVEETPNDHDEEIKKRPIFRNPNYQLFTVNGKKRTYKSLKQILAQERTMTWPPNTPLYSNIGAPPSLKPPKKYSDISGLEAKYTDPQTKLYFANSDEFATIRTLPSDIIAGYLNLRGAINPIA